MTDFPPTRQGLLEVRTFIVQVSVLNESIRFLQEVGSAGCEGFVLWGGKLEESHRFRFSTAIVPEQEAVATERGLLVIVDGEALFRVNKMLHECQQMLAGQVHTHPTSAYHSSTDDHFPLVTLLGALSVVLPDFAKNAPGDIDAWAWYRLMEYGRWMPLGKKTEVLFE